ncbi:MAG: hypothetical protein K6E54_02920 [Bacteroidaceae bacterium]|jgi:hypothetical protein|nr:hypothetical protein [Bacteroidaceae bacterium]
MKRIIFTLLCIMTWSLASAYDYPYMVFKTSDGTLTSVAVTSLEITISGTKLVVKNASGTTSFSLSDLSKMYFSTEANSIEEIESHEENEVEIFSVTGVSYGKYVNVVAAKERLPKGVYVVNSNGKTSKILVR